MKNFIFVCLCVFMATGSRAATLTAEDSLILNRFWKYATEHQLEKMPVSARIFHIGSFFLGKPYKAGTLNVTRKEMPVLNLRELDCVTFLENTLALAFLSRYDEASTGEFIRNIIRFRYRNGEIVDYASRLHYSGDWLYEMQKHHYLKDLTQEIGGIVHPKKISYMSEHPDKYAPLVADPSLVMKIRDVETVLNKRTYYYVPKDRIAGIYGRMKTGDVLLLTTSIKGLDTAHVGIAVKKGNKVYLMHASSLKKKVVLSEETLDEYLGGIKTHTGIMVARVQADLGPDILAQPEK